MVKKAKKKESQPKKRIVHVLGKRKTAIARTTIADGKGRIRVNSTLLENMQPEFARMRIQETLLLAREHVDLNNLNISVNVKGGGVMGQAEAISSSIARGLIEWSGSDELHDRYQSYNRTLIAGDIRLTETHKPGQSSKGPRHKRQKSYR